MSEPDQREPERGQGAEQPDPIDLEPAAEPTPEVETEGRDEAEPQSAFEPEVLEVTITEPSGKAETKDAPEKPLVRPGLGGAKLALGLGVLLLLGALVASGIRAGGLENAGARVVALAIAVTLFQTLLHTGTGVAAVMIAARFERRPTGALELAAARMFACVGAFQLVFHLPTVAPGTVGLVIGAVLGLLAYAAMVWAIFRLSRIELGIVVAGHVLLLIAVTLGTQLTHLYRSAVEGLIVVVP